MPFVADFETTTSTTSTEYTRVWAWAVTSTECPDNVTLGTDIESFIDFMHSNPGDYYFHNLGFDGVFIMSYMLENGFQYSDDLIRKSFSALISSTNKIYQIKVKWGDYSNKNRNVCTIKDSYKKLPYSVDRIAEAFGIEESKLELDYDTPRPIGHALTEHEKEYIKADVIIVAKALAIQFEQGLTKLTAGADALAHCKATMHFSKYFPTLPLDVDAEIRLAYKGGFSYVNKKHRGKILGAGRVYDVNSLYPAMMQKRLPIGIPKKYEGEYNGDKLFIAHFWATAKIKDGFIPCIQLKKNAFYNEHEYIELIEEPEEFYMTSVDLKLFFDHYDVDVIEWVDGWKFNSSSGMFDPYINYWMNIKMNSEGAMRELAKLMLNSLYGKLATNPDVTGKYVILDEGIVKYVAYDEKEYREPVYTAAGCFITAYGRDTTIRACQRAHEQGRFIYADTDSIHLLGDHELSGLDVHKSDLGKWKLEYSFIRCKYLRSKTYMDVVEKRDDDGGTITENVVKCAGLMANKRGQLTLDNFNIGYTMSDGKLRPKHVKGGVLLLDAPFRIRAA